jgi:hypothetical protein
MKRAHERASHLYEARWHPKLVSKAVSRVTVTVLVFAGLKL